MTWPVEHCRRTLALRDHYLDKTSKILDFGCGEGKFVYHFRDADFDAYGFDIHDYLDLRSPSDRQFFQIVNKGGDTSDYSLDWTQYRLPYADGTFDFVFSFQTLEHVQNHDAVLRELARVMKPQGIAIHVFPSRYKFIEPHTFVPFGGMTKAYWYNYLWAMLGIRNQFQKGWSPKETATRNVKYGHTGTNYLSPLQLRAIGRKYYEVVHFAPQLWLFAIGRTGWRLTRWALIAYTLFNEIVWVLEKPRHTSANSS